MFVDIVFYLASVGLYVPIGDLVLRTTIKCINQLRQDYRENDVSLNALGVSKQVFFENIYINLERIEIFG